MEADESDRSFLRLSPEAAVVTNLELDHHTTYRSLIELEEAVAQFARPASVVVVGVEAARAGTESPRSVVAPGQSTLTFGIGEGDLAAEDLDLPPLGARFTVKGVPVALGVPGRHNVLNALAALAACQIAGVDLAAAAPALSDFTGAGRRFEDRGTTGSGARVFDDYAHHPAEVRATLEAARTLQPRRVVACFQPHLYSRTRHLADDFGKALALADVIVVLDVYPARERPDDFPGVSGWLVARAAASAAGGRPVYWAPGMDDAERLLRATLVEGDVLLTLGAGDVDRVAARLVAQDGAAADGRPTTAVEAAR